MPLKFANPRQLNHEVRLQHGSGVSKRGTTAAMGVSVIPFHVSPPALHVATHILSVSPAKHKLAVKAISTGIHSYCGPVLEAHGAGSLRRAVYKTLRQRMDRG